jgi:hypothetical protein
VSRIQLLEITQLFPTDLQSRRSSFGSICADTSAQIEPKELRLDCQSFTNPCQILPRSHRSSFYLHLVFTSLCYLFFVMKRFIASQGTQYDQMIYGENYIVND